MKANLTISPRELYQLISEAMAAKGVKVDSVNVVAQTNAGPNHLLSIVRHQQMTSASMRGTLTAGSTSVSWDEE